MIDGVEQEPQVFLYESSVDKRVKVLLDKNKRLIKASKLKSNGDISDIIHLGKDEYVEVRARDLDETQDEEYDIVSCDTNSWRSSIVSVSFSMYLNTLHFLGRNSFGRTKAPWTLLIKWIQPSSLECFTSQPKL